jgi:hypothetical protein
MFIPHIITSKAAIVTANGVPVSIDTSHPNYSKVVNLLTTSTATSLSQVVELMKPVMEFNRAISNSEFEIINGNVCINIDGYNFPLAEELKAEVLRISRATGDLMPLANFVTKLAANPDKDVHQQLYGFIKSCGLSLTESGDFLAYKRIRNDYKDIYTGTMDNTPGCLVEMPRFAVEKDPSKACSTGLHFAAWGYLDSYASKAGSRTVIVKISPADVVSIPYDYNNMKGRTSKYFVLKEIEVSEELKSWVVFDDSPYSFKVDNDFGYDEEDITYTN